MSHAVDIALFLHLMSVVVWVGGMIFAHICLRPAISDMSPQLRLPMWEAVFTRFFVCVTVSILVLLLTGGFLMSRFGGAQAPWPIHAMTGVGVVMMLIFGHIRFAMFPRLRRAVQGEKWPEGAKTIAVMRRMVTLNMILGVFAIAFGLLGRA